PGLTPIEVKNALMKCMKLAAHLNAVHLLDEADNYLESRISQNLQRNSLVSIFLCAMEYYQGILFMTTSRVGTFNTGFNVFNKLEREHDNVRISSRMIEYAKTELTLKNPK
ncbi:MAG: hypothetical protein Q9160_009321, partial [Pyrenula sp. 1 TL-2023]